MTWFQLSDVIVVAGGDVSTGWVAAGVSGSGVGVGVGVGGIVAVIAGSVVGLVSVTGVAIDVGVSVSDRDAGGVVGTLGGVGVQPKVSNARITSQANEVIKCLGIDYSQCPGR